jgi:4-hydroxy-3-polyprenylbenzoate decarboxylase
MRIGISVLMIAFTKSKLNHARTLHESLVQDAITGGVKFIVYVDDVVEATDAAVVTWNAANNMDARRDVFIRANAFGSVCGIDGTRKTKQYDNFTRPWPNVIVMDDDTIRQVDNRWSELGLGPFVPSPSYKFKRQVFGKGAVVEE